MSSTGPDYTHDDPDRVLACPECDRAGQLRHRQDGVVKCYECGTECDPEDVVDRTSERGEHTPKAACARGGYRSTAGDSGASDEFMRKIAKMPKGPRTGPLADSD